jgi:6-phosphofructokinase 2
MEATLTLTMNPSLDISTEVEEIVPERKLRTAALRREPGGGGINVARGIHMLGGEVTAVYPFGGPTGEMLKGLIEQEGIKHQPIPIAHLTRESFAILERSSGNPFHFVSPGPELSQYEWQQCLDEIAKFEPKPSYIIASGSLPRGVPKDFYARIARIAHKRGMRMILDTSGEPLQVALEEGVYLIKPNKHEFQGLVGHLPEAAEEQAALAREFIERGGTEIVILTLGSEGVLLTSRDQQHRVRSPRVEGVSPVGAGDSFIAVFIFNLARGRSLQEALFYGVAAATAALLTPGTELYRTGDIERFYQQICREQG